MHILAFSDLHSNELAAEELVQKAAQDTIDVVVGAGDFGTMRKRLEAVIDVLSEIQQPMVFVPGNGESLQELTDACRQYANIHILHGTAVDLCGKTFFGIGYGIPVTPFGDWSCDLTEDQANQLLAEMPKASVFLTHSPPLGHVDMNSRGNHVGSVAVLDAMQRCQPPIVLCGHVHDCWNQTSQLNGSTVYNLGPRGRIIEA